MTTLEAVSRKLLFAIDAAPMAARPVALNRGISVWIAQPSHAYFNAMPDTALCEFGAEWRVR
jgi:hypothetical protein